MRSALAFVLIATGIYSLAYAGDVREERDARRHEVMASKRYARICKSHNKKFGEAYAKQFADYPVTLRCRITPEYPEKCMSRAKSKEVIRFVFDVDSSGLTQNIRLLNASNDCLIEPAAASLLLWTFEPSSEGATDLETDISFELAK